MVSRDALLRPIVSLILLIWSLTLLRWLVDRSGAMKAPRTLVGVLSGIGGIEMFAPSMARGRNRAQSWKLEDTNVRKSGAFLWG